MGALAVEERNLTWRAGGGGSKAMDGRAGGGAAAAIGSARGAVAGVGVGCAELRIAVCEGLVR